MPYPSLDLLEVAASNLKGCHPLTVISIPALVLAASESGGKPTDLLTFGSAQEKRVLEAFRVNETGKPYLNVWGGAPALVNHDYPGSTLQRLRTNDSFGRSLLHDDYAGPGNKRTKFGLKAEAGRILAETQKPVDKASLAAWLGRENEFATLDDLLVWFDATYPMNEADLALVYRDQIAPNLRDVSAPFAPQPASSESLLDRLIPASAARSTLVTTQQMAIPGLAGGTPPATEELKSAIGDHVDDLLWTREVCQYTLHEPDPDAIASRVLADLALQHIELPDAERLVRRCVTALLVGHLILQGPPGTGKTTLARALARGFNCDLVESTATSDWSPFHVVGGLRPNPAGGLSPVYGKVAEAALRCVEVVRASVNAEADLDTEEDNDLAQAAWLFIDEFNRADIDKAIGNLYTLLSSCDPRHLAASPLDLWFESSPGRAQLWVPARFRIIGAMNDLDTSFVNRMSQGLTRRFQFVTVGVPDLRATAEHPVTSEMENAFLGAYAWLDRTYGGALAVASAGEFRSRLNSELEMLQKVIDGLRRPNGGVSWPVGTAQVVDVLRVLLIHAALEPDGDSSGALDTAVADRLVPQMAGIDDDQFDAFRALLSDCGLIDAVAALAHLLNPHAMP